MEGCGIALCPAAGILQDGGSAALVSCSMSASSSRAASEMSCLPARCTSDQPCTHLMERPAKTSLLYSHVTNAAEVTQAATQVSN